MPSPVSDVALKQSAIGLHDPVLGAWLGATDEEGRQRALADLLARAQPVIDGVLSRGLVASLSADDRDDLAATVRLRLLRRLRTMLQLDEDGVIERFRDYVATLTFNTIHDLLRERFPERTRLRNRLRYVLGHDERLAIWSSRGGLLCGLRPWSAAEVAGVMDERPLAATRAMLRTDAPGDALVAIFRARGTPLLLDDLVDLVAKLWGVTDRREETLLGDFADSAAIEQRLEAREYVTALWEEIRELPPRQCASLLLNLRDADGSNAAAFFVQIGIARFEDIAAAAGIPIARLAELWNDLPVDDRTIAAILGATRQQVINLRKSARARLARRLEARERRARFR
jgi:hypothetical protein